MKMRLAYKWQVTIAVSLGMFMSLMDMTIVNVAIPQMQSRFGANIHDVQWVITIYMLTQLVVIPIAPYLSAKFGEKRAYVWTLIAFLGGSLLCGLAWDLPSLVFFRFVQGIGGGILLPMVMTLQYHAFPREERGLASSALGISMMTATVIGPALGGYLVFYLGWQWAFFINVPLGIVTVILAQKILRPVSARPQTRFDGLGFLTAAGGCVALVYSLAVLTSGDYTFINFLLLPLGLLLLLAFVGIELRRTQRGQEPLLDLRRFKDLTFTLSGLALVIYSVVLFGLLFLIPVYLQSLHHETSLQAGLIQTAQAVATLLILSLSGKFSDRIGPRPIALLGLVLLLITTVLMRGLGLETPVWMLIGVLVVLGLGNGLAQQIPVSAMSRIERDELQEVTNGSTLVTVLRALAAPIGVTLVSSVVQVQTQTYMKSLAVQQLPGELLTQQSALLAMHDGFLLEIFLSVIALAIMYFVPKRRKSQDKQPEPIPVLEEVSIL